MTIHPTAYISPDAQVDASCQVGPHATVDGPVRIGANTQIGPSTVILGHTTIGEGCTIHAHAVIGDIPQDHKFAGEISFCRIGDRCVIREGATVHRACLPGEATVIGNDCYLMTNSHVAHDCHLAAEVTLISGALLGGHVQVGEKAIISGNTAIHQFVRVGELAMVGAVAMIAQDIPPFAMTNHVGEIAGLNTVGLMRAGISSQEREELKALLKVIYRSGISFERSIELAHELSNTAVGKRFVQFFDVSSRRGIRRLKRKNKLAA